MRNNLDGDVTKSYRMNTQFMFECVLCWLALGSSVATFDVLTSGLMFSEKFLMSDVLVTNLMLTGLLFLFTTFTFILR